MRQSRWLLALVAFAGLTGVALAALPVPPPPDHRINDYANALSQAERTRLEDLLRGRERESSNQIVVAIFRSLEGENLEDYSIRLAQAWRIGQKGLDNGVIFLVFIDDRKMRLEVGYGLEPKLTDALSSQILRQVVAPRFREGKIAEGIGAGLTAIEQAIAGTYHAQPAPARGGGPGIMPIILLFIVVAGLFSIIIPALLKSHVRRQGWTGGSRGWGGPIVFPGGWGGGGFGGGGGGGGGGDFSGGGGGFGGGGASGDW